MLKIDNIIKKQHGFTAIEMLAGIAIIAIIGAAVATGVFQVFTGSSQSNARGTAINDVRNVVDWITRDTRGAENVTIVSNSLSISWYDYNSSTNYVVTYSFTGTNLNRTYQKRLGETVVETQQIAIAQNIKEITFTPIDPGVQVTVTSEADSALETRTFTVYPRNFVLY